jgi:hypothetical protein
MTMLCRLFAGAALLDAVIRTRYQSWVTWNARTAYRANASSKSMRSAAAHDQSG